MNIRHLLESALSGAGQVAGKVANEVNPMQHLGGFGKPEHMPNPIARKMAELGQPLQHMQPMMPKPMMPRLSVEQSQAMQPSTFQFEDDFTPRDALENTGYFNPQTTMYGYKQQNAPLDNPQQPNYLQNYLRQRLGL